MALRFQGKDDEFDQAAREERGPLGLSILLFVLFAVIIGVSDWVTGRSLASYSEGLGELLALGFAWWFLSPFYYEFRIRSKENFGALQEVEERISALVTVNAEVLKKLERLEQKSDAILIDRYESLERLLNEIRDRLDKD